MEWLFEHRRQFKTSAEVMLGSHNQETIEKAVKIIGSGEDDLGAHFAQLLGMRDNLTFALGKNKYNAYKVSERSEPYREPYRAKRSEEKRREEKRSEEKRREEKRSELVATSVGVAGSLAARFACCSLRLLLASLAARFAC